MRGLSRPRRTVFYRGGHHRSHGRSDRLGCSPEDALAAGPERIRAADTISDSGGLCCSQLVSGWSCRLGPLWAYCAVDDGDHLDRFAHFAPPETLDEAAG